MLRSTVSAVLGALDQLGVRYVTVADFEDELTRGGRTEPDRNALCHSSSWRDGQATGQLPRPAGGNVARSESRADDRTV
jgi:hypothetical protein